jgi:hypothetical protein
MLFFNTQVGVAACVCVIACFSFDLEQAFGQTLQSNRIDFYTLEWASDGTRMFPYYRPWQYRYSLPQNTQFNPAALQNGRHDASMSSIQQSQSTNARVASGPYIYYIPPGTGYLFVVPPAQVPFSGHSQDDNAAPLRGALYERLQSCETQLEALSKTSSALRTQISANDGRIAQCERILRVTEQSISEIRRLLEDETDEDSNLPKHFKKQ